MSKDGERSDRPGAADLECGLETLHRSMEFRDPIGPPDAHEHLNNHLALIYESRDEQFAAVIPFVRQGLERGKHCLYIADENSRAEVLKTLREADVDVDAALESGALDVLTADETYLKDGTFDLEDSLALLEEALERGTTDFEGLRVTVEETWLLGEDSTTEDFMALEARISDLFRNEECVALCQYNRERFSPAVVRDVIRTHPHLVYDGEVNDNVYYTPPDEFFGRARPATEVERKLGTLQERTETKRNHQRVVQALQTAREGISLLDDDGEFIYVNDAYAETFGYDPAEIIGEHWNDLGIEADPEYVHEEVLPTIEREGQWTGTTACVRSDDSTFLAQHSLTQTEDGELICVIRDVTKQRCLESEVEEIYGRISDAFYALDPNWRFTYVNERAAELIDFTGEGLEGKNVWETFEWAADSTLREEYERAMETQEPTSFEFYYPDPLGAWFQVNAYPSATGLSVYFRDITERKAREQDLELFRTLLDHSTDSVLVVDPETARYLDVNETACHRRGYSREEFLQLTVPDLETELPDLEAWQSFVEELKAERRITFNGEHRRKDGSTYPLEVNATYVELDREYVVAVARDVSERRERERELERAFDLLEKTERIADVGGWEIDVDTQNVFWTDHVFELLEVDADEEPPLEEALAMYHEEDQPIVEGAIEEALETGEPFNVEARIHTESGEIRWLRLQGVPETNNGQVVSLRGAAHDITEHKERERQLEELVDRLEESNERLEQFAYAASHDLQEPLRMVSSYLQLLERRYADEFDEDAAEFIDFAVDGADRMRAMIDSLLVYSRVETEGDPLEPIALDAVLEDVLEDLHVRIAESDAEITAESLPSVEGDAGQLRQVLQNLLENAIMYSGDEPPRIHVSAERDGSEWIVSVRDEGVGIDPENADEIFDVFNRLHSREEHPGTGIGLALVERIVERHGGDIWVDSKPGDGSTFSVSFPASQQ